MIGHWLKRAAKWLPVIALVMLGAFWRLGAEHWLAVHTGSVNTPGTPLNYNFFSGAGSDISELAIVGAVVGGYRKHNCHQPGCWRIGRHAVNGSPWCDRHHQEARGGGSGDG